MWLPDTERQLVRQIAPAFQQTSGLKLDAERLREKGIVKLNLRYTKVTNEDVRWSPPVGCGVGSTLLYSHACIPVPAASFLTIPGLVCIQALFQMDLLLKNLSCASSFLLLARIQAVPRIAHLPHRIQS